MDDLLSRQRKEIRDLAARITQKKKNATKKTRRGVNSECEALEREVKERHVREVAALEGLDVDSVDLEPEGLLAGEGEKGGAEVLSTLSPQPPPPTTASTIKKPHRQKARLARRAAEAAALSAQAEAEAATLPNHRQAELVVMRDRLSALGLVEKEIAPDGHCLFAAFADQLNYEGVGYKEVRAKCAEYMRTHKVEFEPFVETGGEGGFEEYVKKVEETSEWGGHVEVLAISRAYGVVTNIVQAEGREVERMNGGDGGDGDGEVGGKSGEVWLGYYRHCFGLGEHYNSLRKKNAKERE